MNIDTVFLLSMNRASLVMNRYVNKRLRYSVDESMNINTFKILNAIKNSNGVINEKEYSRIGCDRSTFHRNIQIIINGGLCVKGEIPVNERRVRKARIVYKLTNIGEDFLIRSIPIIVDIDKELKKLWERSHADNISNRALYLLDPKKYGNGEKATDLNSSENFASIVNGFCLYIKKIKKIKNFVEK